jgi:hypothetical protein
MRAALLEDPEGLRFGTQFDAYEQQNFRAGTSATDSLSDDGEQYKKIAIKIFCQCCDEKVEKGEDEEGAGASEL